MGKSKKQRNKIEVDTFEIGLKEPYYKLPKNIERYQNLSGLIYRINTDNIYFKLSSKITAKHNDIGAFNLNNYKEVPCLIQDISGIKVDEDEFLYKTIPYSIHVKNDIHTNELPAKYISLLRELFKRSTDKFDVYKYSDLTYENGLQIIPKPNIKTDLTTGLTIVPKTLDNYRFIIYIKGAELNKPDNKEFRTVFDFDYLQYLNKVIRFEYQMRTFEDMRKAFNTDNPTLYNIFNSDTNPVYDFFLKLLKESEKEESNDNR